MPTIYEIYGTDAHLMAYSLMSAADVAAMIPKKASIALKPNLVIAAGPEGGATTHPGVLSGCIAYLQENGFSDISVIEGSSERRLRKTGAAVPWMIAYGRTCIICRAVHNLVNYAKESNIEKRNIFLTFVLAALKTAKCRDLLNRPAVPLVS